jgi:starch-binding outer membrane protein, SusD/RagB family
MKNRIIGFLIVSCIIAFTACTKGDLLDPKTNNDLNEATVFSDSARTIDFLMGIYTDVGYTFSYRRYGNIFAGTAEAGDEAMGRLNGPTQPFVYILSSNISPSFTIPYDNAWNTAWTNIRRANVFLGHVNNSPISPALKAQSVAEARFLRAWYYSILLKNFGGVPLLGDRLFGASDDLQIARNTYEECVNYIVTELDAAAAGLPIDHLAQDYGRITKGACLALKSRVLLFAASPLFNGGGIATDPAVKALTSYPTFDASRWQKAAAAALEVINLNTYSLLEDNTTAPGFGFSKVFLTRKNSEYIFAGMQAPGKNMEQNFLPPSRGNTTPQSVPTHNLAEAFGMIDGKPILDGGPIPKSPLYNPNDPFVNRDPRFNYTFIYNGTLWYRTASNSKEPIFTYENAPQDGYKTVAWATGYYWRKMMSDNTAQNGGPNTERCLPLIRYAEILLNYAEAANEIGSTNLAYEQLRLIRKRAGIQAGSDNLYGLKANMTKDEMRTVIMNERRVELAYEDHRFWDVRRWKTAPVDFNITMYAIKIVKTGTTTYTYSKEVVNANSVHKFRDINYLFPIMASEISKNRALIQNPGY